MKKNPGQNIVIVGCGNVAWHMAKHFQALKTYSVSVHNHKANPALNDFKTILKCKTVIGLQYIPGDADFYFICVADRFISEVAKQISIKNPNAVLLHTSGSAKLSDLGERVHDTAVFYPLQTFSRNDAVNWSEVPIIIEVSNKTLHDKIKNLASHFTKTVKVLNYKERLKLHLSAVLVNNFTNALYVAASSLSADDDSKSIALLLPLIKQTTLKLEHIDPLVAQTGPAKRGDKVVLKKHLHLLSKEPELKKIYKQLSKLIAHQQKNQDA